jgi:hypothetical protein
MLGYSGIVVVLMPNGSTYYYASDHREFTWTEALRESDKISSFCQPVATTAAEVAAIRWSRAYAYVAPVGSSWV